MQEAFKKKLEFYKSKATSPSINEALRKAFALKLE